MIDVTAGCHHAGPFFEPTGPAVVGFGPQTVSIG